MMRIRNGTFFSLFARRMTSTAFVFLFAGAPQSFSLSQSDLKRERMRQKKVWYIYHLVSDGETASTSTSNNLYVDCAVIIRHKMLEV